MLKMIDVVRLKRDSTTYKAKKVLLRKDVDLDDFLSANISSFENKRIFDFINKPFSKTRYVLDKWAIYNNDVSLVPDDLLPFYLIDKKYEIYDDIDYIFREISYLYFNYSDLKRSIFLRLQESWPEVILKKCINYYFDKKIKSSFIKKKRFLDKSYANINLWNYFVTFTYDDLLMNEVFFVKKLKSFLSNKSVRNSWKYMGAFERSRNGRLHFHALMSIPESDIKNLNIKPSKYYDKSIHDINIAYVSDFLKEKFGRCDFKNIIPGTDDFSICLDYICKYIFKTNGKIIYSRGLLTENLGLIKNFDSHILGYTYSSSEFVYLESSCKKDLKIL